MNKAYGYVNGKAVYSRDEFIFEKRGFGAIENDTELLAYAEKVSWGWQDAGWKRSFTNFYLSDYELNEPYASLTHTEFERLKQLQAEAKQKEKELEDAKEWKYVETVYYADNSEEEIWENKYGERKSVMAVGPHGDMC